jgi:hypothetical protein
MTESAFSSSAQAVIQRAVVLDNNETRSQLSVEEFRDYYELEWTAHEIISKDYKRVSRSSFPNCDNDGLNIRNEGCSSIPR